MVPPYDKLFSAIVTCSSLLQTVEWQTLFSCMPQPVCCDLTLWPLVHLSYIQLWQFVISMYCLLTLAPECSTFTQYSTFECNLLQSHVASFEWSHALHLPDWMNWAQIIEPSLRAGWINLDWIIAHWWVDRQTDEQSVRQTDRVSDRQTECQTDRQSDKQGQNSLQWSN